MIANFICIDENVFRLRPRRARFRFARPDHSSSTIPILLNFRIARHSGAMSKELHNRL
jgi:hypothetical protein